ncbi:LuxR C-terminal-related transcriptional regulator, partial [Sphingobium sp.]|uniref:LuxR C-terminal-related transcriptional regulator n=1 Tax=Sphingobium sp. TaxID=1912891 RepID=UPI002BC17BF5
CLLDKRWQGYRSDGTRIDAPAHPAVRALAGEEGAPALDFLLGQAGGRQTWATISAIPLSDTTCERLAGAIVLIEEIDRPRHAIRCTTIADACLRRFAEHSSVALWIAHAETGDLEYRSPATERLWDIDSNIPASSLPHIHPDDRQSVTEYRALASSGQVQRHDYRIVDMAGVIRCKVRETCFPIPPGPGEENWIGGIIEDISPEILIYLVQRVEALDGIIEAQMLRCASRIKRFSTASELLKVAEILNPGCLIVDLRGTENADGALAQIVEGRPSDLQLIFVGDAATPPQQVISAMRGGAIDFLIAPMVSDDLDRAICRACEALPHNLNRGGPDQDDGSDRLLRLPRREREVLLGLLNGGTNKSIARVLGISPRTVEAHRAHLMERLNVSTLSALLQVAHRAGMGSQCG